MAATSNLMVAFLRISYCNDDSAHRAKSANCLDDFSKDRLLGTSACHLRKDCERLKREFEKAYARTQPKAIERLERDWERMITYYNFPAAHWKHVRTTKIIESRL